MCKAFSKCKRPFLWQLPKSREAVKNVSFLREGTMPYSFPTRCPLEMVVAFSTATPFLSHQAASFIRSDLISSSGGGSRMV